MFHFQIVYTVGAHNRVVDASSKRPQVNTVAIVHHKDLKEMKARYLQDSEFGEIIRNIQHK